MPNKVIKTGDGTVYHESEKFRAFLGIRETFCREYDGTIENRRPYGRMVVYYL